MASCLSWRWFCSAAPVRINRLAWRGLRAERPKLARKGSPAPMSSRPCRSVTAAWTRCTDSTIPLRRSNTSRGEVGAPRRATLNGEDG